MLDIPKVFLVRKFYFLLHTWADAVYRQLLLLCY